VTLSEPRYQLVAFAIYFAAIWGLIFRFNVVPSVKIGWGPLAGTFFFTGLIGTSSLLLAYRFLPDWYTQLFDSDSAAFRLIGYVFHVGFCEELCKMLPVAALMFFFRKRLGYGDIVMLGVFPGLGFSAFENLLYSLKGLIDVIAKTISAAPTIANGDDGSAREGRYILRLGRDSA
jgi:RsiW-degrading membrane proteinase PrsW (M82 family)